MAIQVTKLTDRHVDRIIRLAASIPATDQCTERVAPPSIGVIALHIGAEAGEVWISDDGKAAGMSISGRVTWLLCRIEDMPTSGKDLLDSLVPPHSGNSGMVQNEALRAAITAVRPDITAEGTMMASAST